MSKVKAKGIRAIEGKLAVVDIAIPEPKADEVLLENVAAGINMPDVLQAKGLYPPPKGVTDILGLEVSGVVLKAGSEASLSKGDEVCALLAGGGYASHSIAKASHCLPIPKGVSLADAAALPEVFFTVWSNLVWAGKLCGGEWVLIHGGGGGIGSAAIQVASQVIGAKVIATAGGKAKCRRCLRLGASLAIDYHSEDFVEKTIAYTKEHSSQNGRHQKGGQKGVNLVFDIIGGDYVEKNIKVLAPEGRLINIAFQKGAKVTLNLLPVMLKRLTLSGSTLRIRQDSFKAKIATELKQKVWGHFSKLTASVNHRFAAAKAQEAHRLMAKGEHSGKIVLLTDGKNW